MKKLVLIIAILALCAPSFGAILVYKQSSSVKGFIFDVNEYSKDVTVQRVDPCDANQTNNVDTTTLTSAQDASDKFDGYVVMDVDVNTLVINDKDTNDSNSLKPYNIAAEADGAAMLLVDKKAKKYTKIRLTLVPKSATDLNYMVDANFGYVDHDGIFKAGAVLNKKGTATKKTLAYLNLTGHLNSEVLIDLSDHNDANNNILDGSQSRKYTEQEFGLDTMTGSLGKADIDGSKKKVLVPTSLKGHGNNTISEGTRIDKTIQFRGTNPADANFYQLNKTKVTTMSDVHVDTELGGTASLKLDKKATQTANKATTPTTKSTLTALITALGSGYSEAPLPPAVPYID